MDNYLTTRQVLELLKVDRITVYRMLDDGRIKGVKVGQQWRFERQEVERLLGKGTPQPETNETSGDSSFPTHCVQTIQDLFSDVGQVSALVVDSDGVPLTEVSNPCRHCQILLQSQSGQAACQDSWKEMACQSRAGNRYFTCHAGVQYVSAPIMENEKLVGYFLAGEFFWQPPDPQQETERTQRLAGAHQVPSEVLSQAARTIPVIEAQQHAKVESWPAAAARAVQSILRERSGFIDRLHQIATLTRINP